jgi:hypothetical protein
MGHLAHKLLSLVALPVRHTQPTYVARLLARMFGVCSMDHYDAIPRCGSIANPCATVTLRRQQSGGCLFVLQIGAMRCPGRWRVPPETVCDASDG